MQMILLCFEHIKHIFDTGKLYIYHIFFDI
jgi:hypothetical protein